MDGVGGYEGWRWIFILEGLLTVVIAVVAFFTVYDFPETAKFLTEPERAWVVTRLRYQGSKDSGQMVAEDEHFKWKYVRDAFSDWQIYLALWSLSSILPPLAFLLEYSTEMSCVSSVLGHRLSSLRHLPLPPQHHP